MQPKRTAPPGLLRASIANLLAERHEEEPEAVAHENSTSSCEREACGPPCSVVPAVNAPKPELVLSPRTPEGKEERGSHETNGSCNGLLSIPGASKPCERQSAFQCCHTSRERA